MADHGLGAAMRAARMHQGLTHKAAVEKAGAGISVALWSKIENDRPGPYRPSSYAAVDRALGWAIGTAAMLAGSDTPVMPPDGPEQDRIVLALVEQMVARLDLVEGKVDAMTERMRALEHPTRQRPTKPPQSSRSTGTARAKPHTS